ncbi:MAG: alpha-galactosidase [Lentisphaeria bacterium]|nr:alpha-galactosidase [Lentisphaeria bacterium]
MDQTYRMKIANAAVSGELNGWDLSFTEEIMEQDCSLLHLELKSCTAVEPPEITVSFEVPMLDTQVKWKPRTALFDSHHLQPEWWTSGREACAFNRSVPICAYQNLAGINTVCIACSETFLPVTMASGPRENGQIHTEIKLFREPCGKERTFHVSFRIDRRRIFYADVLQDVTAWQEKQPGCPSAMYAPANCRLPVYSTWYQCQKGVSQQFLEEELDRISLCGLDTIIIDDGWQCEGVDGGGLVMTSCGEWNVYPGKFPDMRSLVDACHKRGIKVMLWVALPYIGADHAELFEKFSKMSLRKTPKLLIVDPRYPEVRQYLAERCASLVREYRLDGLKLDFIDTLFSTDEAFENERIQDGRDTVSLMDGVKKMLDEVCGGLQKLNPEIMIEFRQLYTGPGMRHYANIFRASDCPFDLLQNRVRTVDLRLLSGDAPIHSDMVIWPEWETPETAALQILNVLFSTPQISCRLSALPESHLKMIRFWMDFCKEHRETLQESALHPEHPELSYPVVTAESRREIITALYGKNCMEIRGGKPHYLVNATHETELFAELRKACTVTICNVFGEETERKRLEAGLHRISVPLSGMAVFEPCGE